MGGIKVVLQLQDINLLFDFWDQVAYLAVLCHQYRMFVAFS